MKAEFATNARAETLSEIFRKQVPTFGYLVPPNALTAKLKQQLSELAGNGEPLIVDNGMFDDIGRISRAFQYEASIIRADRQKLEVQLKRDPMWRDLSTKQQKASLGLAKALSKQAGTALGESLENQRKLATFGIVGVEDITAALWLRARLDAPEMPGTRASLRNRNRIVAKHAASIQKTLAPKERKHYLPVASALGYDSAFDAGVAFAEAGLIGAAMGFGAYMADDFYADSVVVGGKLHKFPRPFPMRYLRTALAARGFWDGWRSATGRAPRRFHFLGLGSPIMLPLVALAARDTPMLTFDATSPIRDAVEGTMYTSMNGYLKIRTRRLSERLASGELRRWTCPCGFCKVFMHAHPFDYMRGRRWASSKGASFQVEAGDLRDSGELFHAYPLMSEPKSGALRKAVSEARSGHNHWVIANIAREISRHGNRRSQLDQYVAQVVKDYSLATSSVVSGEAVAFALEIVRGRWPSR